HFIPPSGVDSNLMAQAAAAQSGGASNLHCMVQFLAVPPPEQWPAWNGAGVFYAAYLSDATYILRVPVVGDVQASLNQTAQTLGALALTVLMPGDKISASLSSWVGSNGPPQAPIKVTALFFSLSDPAAASNSVRT